MPNFLIFLGISLPRTEYPGPSGNPQCRRNDQASSNETMTGPWHCATIPLSTRRRKSSSTTPYGGIWSGKAQFCTIMRPIDGTTSRTKVSMTCSCFAIRTHKEHERVSISIRKYLDQLGFHAAVFNPEARGPPRVSVEVRLVAFY